MSEPQKFIVTFKDGVSKEEVQKYIDQVTKARGTIHKEYDGKFLTGFVAEIPPQTLQAFQQEKSLGGSIFDSIELDSTVTTQ